MPEITRDVSGRYLIKADEAFPGLVASGATKEEKEEAVSNFQVIANKALEKLEASEIEKFTCETGGSRYRWNITALKTSFSGIASDKFPLNLLALSDTFFAKTYPELNVEYALSNDVNLLRPLVFIIDDKGLPILVDGVHRLYKAWKNKVKSLPAYSISMKDAAKFQMNATVPLTKSGL